MLTIKIKNNLLFPITSFKRRYIPLLMVYFSFGAQALATVALTFWEKESLSLSAEQILSVSVWITLPWTAKVLVGQLVDTNPLFNSYRKSWVYLGACIMALGYFSLYSVNKNYLYFSWLGSEYTQYVFAYVLVSIGYMIQDVSADAMSTEVIDRSQPDDEIKKESAIIQILGRLTLMIAGALTAGIGGLLANVMSYDLVFLCALIIPLISISGVTFVRLEENSQGEFKPILFLGGIIYIVFIVVTILSIDTYKQELIHIGSLVFLTIMLRSLLTEIPQQTRITVILGLIALFSFLAVPTIGPGYTWWTIDTLNFDQVFIGILGQVGGIIAIVTLWLAAGFISKSPINKVLFLLIVCNVLFQLPNIALYSGLHELLNIDPKWIALLDASLDTPLSHIAFIPALAFIAYHSPRKNKATWFAVTASLLNIGLTAKQLGSKYLNQVFVVTREVKDKEGIVQTQADYSELGALMIAVLFISIVLPMIFLLLLRSNDKQSD